MKAILVLAVSFLVSFFSVAAFASNGLVVHTAETVIGRFHRADNKAHSYDQTNAWYPYILADGIPTPGVVSNTDGSYTIFFTNLKELFELTVQLTRQTNRQVSVFNVNAHGMPGGVWFPRDTADLNSSACADWREVADADDSVSYGQYYTGIEKDEILAIRAVSRQADVSAYGCVNGLSKWQRTAGEVAGLRSAFAPDAQINFLSCTVGLGTAGDNFTKGLGRLLLGNEGVVRTAIKFGMGDWSMPQGMGFWDYITDDQLAHDNQIYEEKKQDSLIVQTGDIRVARVFSGTWATALQRDQQYMYLNFTPVVEAELVPVEPICPAPIVIEAPMSIRIPGTAVSVTR